MGVPGFFAWLLKTQKKAKIITTSLETQPHTLYIDTNCLIHPQCFKVLHYYNDTLTADKLEKKMFKRILNYIDYLIGYVNPLSSVFIAIDGVAPFAKMSQQRKRRYKTIIDNEIYGKVKEKYGKNTKFIWSNTAITPGTEFMEKLHQEILKHISKPNFKIKYTYSSYHTPGEGEHKILQDIKKNNQDSINKTCVIYGLDADLIFLALASQKSNIYLLREEMYLKKDKNEENTDTFDIITDVAEDLNYVSIDRTVDSINTLFDNLLNIQTNKDFTNDFIVLCYFLGNDFLPNIPSIEIKNDGIDFILDNYSQIYQILNSGITYYSNNKIEINNIFLGLLFERMAKYENYYFEVKYPRWIESLEKRSCPNSSDPFETEIWNIDNMRTFKPDNPIRLGQNSPEQWKFRFYEYYYGSINYQDELIKDMCKEYINGIVWTMKYYFDECPSWTYHYKYNHAPFVSDLSNYFKNNNTDLLNIVIPDKGTISPFIQLLTVVPPTCSNLLPPKYAYLMTNSKSPIIDYYPSSFIIDTLYKESFHKCIPLLPNVNISRVINAVKNIKLTKEEEQRNKTLDNFVIMH